MTRMPAEAAATRAPVLEVRELAVAYAAGKGLLRPAKKLRAVNGVSFEVYAGETLGLVGESGCGKTTLGRCVVRLVPAESGTVRFDGEDLLALRGAHLRRRRQAIQIVFQNPFGSLDPRMTVERIVAEPLITHSDQRGTRLRNGVLALLENVGLGAAHIDRYPHQLSGGQAQRVAIARALALDPKLMVLDEPTSALDVSVQAQILNLLEGLQRKLGVSYLFISHDLSVVQHISHRIAVMYLGEVVEVGSVDGIFSRPAHPYTQALLASSPRIDRTDRAIPPRLEGTVPSMAQPPPGCRFHTRCPYAFARCVAEAPPPYPISDTHSARCHLLDEAPHERPPAYRDALFG
jgi:oligopeptide/dipeptide ABC transporter ATP-binding protein